MVVAAAAAPESPSALATADRSLWSAVCWGAVIEPAWAADAIAEADWARSLAALVLSPAAASVIACCAGPVIVEAADEVMAPELSAAVTSRTSVARAAGPAARVVVVDEPFGGVAR